MLLAQIHRDLQRAASWYPPGDFVRDLCRGGDETQVDEMARRVTEVVTGVDLTADSEDHVLEGLLWDRLCQMLWNCFQEIALAEIPL